MTLGDAVQIQLDQLNQNLTDGDACSLANCAIRVTNFYYANPQPPVRILHFQFRFVIGKRLKIDLWAGHSGENTVENLPKRVPLEHQS